MIHELDQRFKRKLTIQDDDDDNYNSTYSHRQKRLLTEQLLQHLSDLTISDTSHSTSPSRSSQPSWTSEKITTTITTSHPFQFKAKTPDININFNARTKKNHKKKQLQLKIKTRHFHPLQQFFFSKPDSLPPLSDNSKALILYQPTVLLRPISTTPTSIPPQQNFGQETTFIKSVGNSTHFADRNVIESVEMIEEGMRTIPSLTPSPPCFIIEQQQPIEMYHQAFKFAPFTMETTLII